MAQTTHSSLNITPTSLKCGTHSTIQSIELLVTIYNPMYNTVPPRSYAGINTRAFVWKNKEAAPG